jgi:hypothetical protein
MSSTFENVKSNKPDQRTQEQEQEELQRETTAPRSMHPDHELKFGHPHHHTGTEYHYASDMTEQPYDTVESPEQIPTYSPPQKDFSRDLQQQEWTKEENIAKVPLDPMDPLSKAIVEEEEEEISGPAGPTLRHRRRDFREYVKSTKDDTYYASTATEQVIEARRQSAGRRYSDTRDYGGYTAKLSIHEVPEDDLEKNKNI